MRRGRDEKDELERPNYAGAASSASAGSGGSLVQRPFNAKEETGTRTANGGSGSAGSGAPALYALPSLLQLMPADEPDQDVDLAAPSDDTAFQSSVDRKVSAADTNRQARELVRNAIGGGDMQTRLPAVLSSLVANYGHTVVRYQSETNLRFISPANYQVVGLDEYPDRTKRSERYRFHAIPCTRGGSPLSSLDLLSLSDTNVSVRTANYMNSTTDVLTGREVAGAIPRYTGPQALTSMVFHPGRNSRIGPLPPDDPDQPKVKAMSTAKTDVKADATEDDNDEISASPTHTWFEMNVTAAPGERLTLPKRLLYRSDSTTALPFLVSKDSERKHVRGLGTSDSGRFLFFESERRYTKNMKVVCLAIVDLRTRTQQTLLLIYRPQKQSGFSDFSGDWEDGGLAIYAVATTPQQVIRALSKLDEETTLPSLHSGSIKLHRVIGSHDMVMEYNYTCVRLTCRTSDSSAPVSWISTLPGMLLGAGVHDRVVFFDTAVGVITHDLSEMYVHPYPTAGHADVNDDEEDIPRELSWRKSWPKPYYSVRLGNTKFSDDEFEQLMYWSIEGGRVVLAVKVRLVQEFGAARRRFRPGGVLPDDSPSLDVRSDFNTTGREEGWFGYHVAILTPDLNQTLTLAKRKAKVAATETATATAPPSVANKQRRTRPSTDVKAQPLLVTDQLEQALRPRLPPELVSIVTDTAGTRSHVELAYQGWIRVLSTNISLDILAVRPDGYLYCLYGQDMSDILFIAKARVVNRRLQLVARTENILQGLVRPQHVRVDMVKDRVITYSPPVYPFEVAADICVWQFHRDTPTATRERRRVIRAADVKTPTTRSALPLFAQNILSSDGSCFGTMGTPTSPTTAFRVCDLWSASDDRPLKWASLDHKSPIRECHPVRGTSDFVTISGTGDKDIRMWSRRADGSWSSTDPAPYMFTVMPDGKFPGRAGIHRFSVLVWFREFVIVVLHSIGYRPSDAPHGNYIGTFAADGSILVHTDHPAGDLMNQPFIYPVMEGDDTTIAFVSMTNTNRLVNDPMLRLTSSSVTRVGTRVDASDDLDGIWDDMSDDAGLRFEPGRVLTDDQRDRVIAMIQAARNPATAATMLVDDARTEITSRASLLYVFQHTGGWTVAAKPKHSTAAAT